MKSKSNRKPTSLEAEYILKRMSDKNPSDNLFQLAKRINVSDGTLYNLFYKYKNPFQRGSLLIRICADLGINPESVLSQENIKYDRDKELNYWKDKCFKAEEELRLEKEKSKSVLKMLNEHFNNHKQKKVS